MLLKIGKFNFISDLPNRLSNFKDLKYQDEYFWLDGKENKLFVLNTYKFEHISYKYSNYDFERKLKDKFEIIPLYERASKEIDDYIKNIAENKINSQDYSKYDLYKDISLTDILNLNEHKFKFSYDDYFAFNFDKNTIEIGVFDYNPYTEKIDNINECKERLNKEIKKNIIVKEIEKGIVPKFITEIIKINNYLKGKKSCNLIFNGNNEKFKIEEPYLSKIIRKDGNNIVLGSYNDRFNIKELKGIMHRNNILKINSTNLIDIDKQIAISLEDRLKQRIDYLKSLFQEEYRKYREKNLYYDMPYCLDKVINVISINNKDNPEWFNNEISDLSYKYKLLLLLEKAKTIEEVKEITVELEDNELQRIYYGLKDEEENLEEDGEELSEE